MAAVDVLLPYWGDVGYFQEAVSSVLGQTDPDWRLIIVDDAYPSTEPQRWIGELADPRVEYHRNDRNLGANANYRRALDLASAPTVVFLGADDVMLPGYLAEIALVRQRHPAVAVIQPGVEVIDGAGRVYLPLADRVKRWYAPPLEPVPGGRRERVLSGQELALSLVRADWAYFPSLAWTTATVRDLGFQPEWNVVQDLALLHDIAVHGGELVVTSEVVFRYRRHAGSDSSLKAVNGARFDEERSYFAAQAERFAALGWHRAAAAARRHLSSRLNAATLLPTALRLRDRDAAGSLARHVVAG